MRKHFLILFLMALLPLSGWAVSFQDPTVTISANDAAYNTAINDIKGGITVKINNEPLDAAKWSWDGKFYSTSAAATAEDASGLVAPATNISTPDVGTYYIRIEALTSENSGFKVVALIIRQAALVATDYSAATDNDLTYNGKAQELINEAGYGTTGSEAKCGAITYAIGSKVGTADPTDEGATYAAELPKATDAGTYYVFYKFAGSTNYAEVKGCVPVTIKAKSIAELTALTQGQNFVMSNVGPFTYNGKTDQVPAFTVKDKINNATTDITSSVTVYWFPNSTDFSKIASVDLTKAVAPKNVGTYKALLVGTDNYGDRKADDSWTFTINKKDLTLIINNLESTYNGQAVNLNNAKITYLGLCSSDFAASLNNFGKLNVQFTDGSAPTNVKRNNTTKAVEGYDLEIALTEGYDETSLFTNYNLKNEAGAKVTVETGKITNVAGTYKINPVEVTYKPKDIEMEFGSAEPTNPGTAKFEDAEADPAVVGNVEITSDSKKMVTVNNKTESILAALKFEINKYARDASKNVTALEWSAAPVGPYSEKVELKLMTQDEINKLDGEAKTAAQAALDASNNYDFKSLKGNVNVVGKSLTVYVNGTSVEYGTDLTNYNPGYYASNQELGGTLKYTICDVATEEPIEDLENLAIGTYLVTLDKDQITSPTNYTVKTVEPGFLEITPKNITITINPLILNPGTTKDQLNEIATVADYTSQLVGDDTEVKFTYKFNNGSGQGQVTAGYMNGDNLANLVNAEGNFAKGITAEMIQKQVVNNEVVDNGWIDANDRYKVTFVPGALKIVQGGILYLTQADKYLDAKVKAAAEACEDDENTHYTVTFGERWLNANTWYTMVLPFDVKTTELVAGLKGVTKTTDEKTGKVTITDNDQPVYAIVNRLAKSTANKVNFKLEMKSIPANEPFLIKVAEDVKLSNANISFTRTIKYKATPKAEAEGVDYGGNEFIGTYTAVTNLPEIYNTTDKHYAFLGNSDMKGSKNQALDNTWYNAKLEGLVINPMEAYLHYSPDKGSAAAPIITIEDVDFGTGTTSIKTLNVETMKAYDVDGWYTLNGVKLQSMPTEKGIYINNGKKVVVK